MSISDRSLRNGALCVGMILFVSACSGASGDGSSAEESGTSVTQSSSSVTDTGVSNTENAFTSIPSGLTSDDYETWIQS